MKTKKDIDDLTNVNYKHLEDNEMCHKGAFTSKLNNLIGYLPQKRGGIL